MSGSVSEKPRVGIVGAGRVGIDWHLPDIREAGGEVIALADAVPGRAARFADRHGVPRAFDDYRQMLAMPEVDVVAVCTPPHAHAEIAIAAVEAGKHLYLEKPPAMNEAEMAQIVAAVRSAAVRSAGVLAYRHLFECIREGVETQSPPERSMTVMRILDAIYASAESGGRQFIPDCGG